jgi:glucose/arabinose dehydrogenase
MVLAPNGDLFVAERQGGRVSVYRRTGSMDLPGSRMTFAQGLNTPFGLAFHGDWLYVGTQGALLRYAYTPGQTAASGAPERALTLPVGGHSTRNVLFSPKGDKLYLAIGSASNVAEEPAPRATIQEANEDGSGMRTFASGLRNPVGLAWNPDSGKLWAVVNERDGLGDDVPPDYATSVSDGDFYGWPYAYFDGRPDPTFGSLRPDLVAKTRRPDLPIQAHSAPLGIAFYTGSQFPPDYAGSAFIALHGSWNRSQKTGYKVVRSRFQAGQPVGPVEDFLTGFLLERNGGQQVWGRPVGVMVDRDGALLVSDDGGGRIWRVTYSPPSVVAGDANGDGRVDVQDVVLALRLLVGLDPLTPAKVTALDLWPPGAPDGKLTISDLVVLIRKVVMAQ